MINTGQKETNTYFAYFIAGTHSKFQGLKWAARVTISINYLKYFCRDSNISI